MSGPDGAVLAGLVCLAVTTASMPLVLAVLRRAAVIDVPGARSSHVVPTPRGGGLALVVGMLAALAVVRAPGSAPMAGVLVGFAAIGLLDDLRGLPVAPRFAAQLLVGAVAIPWLPAPVTAPWPVLAAAGVLVAVWLCAFVNAFNFMDGINGISGAHALVAGTAFAGVGLHAGVPVLSVGGAVVAAAGLGFLPWNAVRTKVFLGDVGSYALGGALGLLVVVAVGRGVPVEIAVAPVALHLVDTGTTLARRYRAGEDWLRPHRSHVYQRLCDRGWSHRQVAGGTALVSAAVVLCTVTPQVVAGAAGAARVLGGLAAAVLLAAYVAAPGFLRVRDRTDRASAVRRRPTAGRRA